MTGAPPAINLAEDRRSGALWAIFLDIDGTLLDLVDDPMAVKADPPLVMLLDELEARTDGALALVSGRDLSAIDRIMFPRRYSAVGSHGLERRRGGSTIWKHPGRAARLLGVADMVHRRVRAIPGLRLERKECSFTLHFRGCPAAQPEALSLATLAQSQLGEDYRIISGKDVYELIPADADKGQAIWDLMLRPPFRSRRPIFAGDDLTDESGFQVVNEVDGVSILIGDRKESEARYALASPTALRAWLQASLSAVLTLGTIAKDHP